MLTLEPGLEAGVNLPTRFELEPFAADLPIVLAFEPVWLPLAPSCKLRSIMLPDD